MAHVQAGLSNALQIWKYPDSRLLIIRLDLQLHFISFGALLANL